MRPESAAQTRCLARLLLGVFLVGASLGLPGCGLLLPPADRALPVTALGLARLRALGKQAKRGSSAARLERGFWLLALFDHARFAQDSSSRSLLLDELGVPVGERRPSELLTLQVAAGIVAVFDSVAQGSNVDPTRLALAKRARELPDWDARPPDDLGLIRSRLARLRRETVAAQNPVDFYEDALALHAALRLIGYCLGSFANALDAPAADRERLAAHCLLALDESDPSAALNPDARRRAPALGALEYRRRLEELLRGVSRRLAASELGLKRLAESAQQRVAMITTRLATALPPTLDFPGLHLARASRPAPFENTPWLILHRDRIELAGGAKPLPMPAGDAVLDAALRRLVERDPRRRLLVLTAAETELSSVTALARHAARVGFVGLDLAVTPESAPQRMGVLALRLPPGAQRPREQQRLGIIGSESGVVLELVGSALRMRLAGVESGLGMMPRGPSAFATLRAALKTRRQTDAAPPPVFLVLAGASPPVNVGWVVALLETVQHDADGAPLFPEVFLGSPR